MAHWMAQSQQNRVWLRRVMLGGPHGRCLSCCAGGARRGQSLVEFVLILPILILVLVGGFSFGLGLYQGHMASDAVQLPSSQKLSWGRNSAAVNAALLVSVMNSSGMKGSIDTGPLVDNVQIEDVTGDAYVSIMQANKTFIPTLNFIPGFTIRVGQLINKRLLQQAYVGNQPIRSPNTPWVPYGTPAPPPW